MYIIMVSTRGGASYNMPLATLIMTMTSNNGSINAVEKLKSY